MYFRNRFIKCIRILKLIFINSDYQNHQNRRRMSIDKISNTSRIKKSLLIIGSIIIIFLIILLIDDPSIDNGNDRVMGEVWGLLETDGEISSNTSFSFQEFGIYGYDEFNSTVEFSFSNISSVTIIERKGGGEFEKRYSLENRTFRIVIRRGSLYCNLLDGNINLKFHEFYGEPQDDAKYVIFSNYEAINGEASLEHDITGQYDIRTYRHVTAYVNDEVFYLTKGDFIIPDGERSHVTVRGYGIYSFDTMPTIRIDGTVRAEDFTEITSNGLPLERHSAMVFEGIGIELSTIQLPDYNEGYDEYHIPWIVRIHAQGTDHVTVDGSVDPILLVILVIVFLFYIVLVYSILDE